MCSSFEVIQTQLGRVDKRGLVVFYSSNGADILQGDDVLGLFKGEASLLLGKSSVKPMDKLDLVSKSFPFLFFLQLHKIINLWVTIMVIYFEGLVSEERGDC